MKKYSKNKSCKSARKCRHVRYERESKYIHEVQYFSSMFLAMMAAVIFNLISYLPHSFYDSHRVRKDLEKDIFDQLGDYYVPRAYRMDKPTFYKLHQLLDLLLIQHFFQRKPATEIFIPILI